MSTLHQTPPPNQAVSSMGHSPARSCRRCGSLLLSPSGNLCPNGRQNPCRAGSADYNRVQMAGMHREPGRSVTNRLLQGPDFRSRNTRMTPTCCRFAAATAALDLLGLATAISVHGLKHQNPVRFRGTLGQGRYMVLRCALRPDPHRSGRVHPCRYRTTAGHRCVTQTSASTPGCSSLGAPSATPGTGYRVCH